MLISRRDAKIAKIAKKGGLFICTARQVHPVRSSWLPWVLRYFASPASTFTDDPGFTCMARFHCLAPRFTASVWGRG